MILKKNFVMVLKKNFKIKFLNSLTKKKVGMLYTMEPSVDKSLVFCAGTTGKDSSGFSNSILAAITFNNSLKVVNEQIINNPNIQACTAMKRFADRDDLVIGGYKDLLVVRFTGRVFDVLHVVPDVHTSNFYFY